MNIKWRHSAPLLNYLDIMSSVLVLPFTTVVSFFLASLQCNTEEKKNYRLKLVPWLVQAPLLLIVSFAFFPWFISGTLLWLFLCQGFDVSRQYYQVDLKPSEKLVKQRQEDKSTLSVCSTNVLLTAEVLAKWQNVSGVYNRLYQIAKQIASQRPKHLKNFKEDMTKEESIIDHFPRIDVVCFQEVYERSHALALMYLLREQYSHFAFDFSCNKWNTNRLCLSSGLMIASKYPIIEANFTPFTRKKGWQNCLSYGVAIVKLQLDQGVAVVADLHTVAYEGKDQLLGPALDEVLLAMENFKAKFISKGEKIVAEVIAGDFNLDNMSPSDMEYNKSKLFQQYTDPAILQPGEDKEFAIGTEMRQLTIMQPEVTNNSTFKKILIDDVRRRYYIIDANVQVQDFDLMVVDPQGDSKGEIKKTREGGCRRIDRILHNSQLTSVQGMAFSSALSGLTDHIPVVMTLQIKT